MSSQWFRLVRFQAEDGSEVFGEPIIQNGEELAARLESNSLEAIVYRGSSPFDLKATEERVKVKKLLPALKQADVPIVRCIGLNYMKHIAEGGRKPPPYPSLFIKPSTCVAGFNEDIPIPKLAQEDQLDYEGELVSIHFPRCLFNSLTNNSRPS
jgi:2-keto-4-pentenoate hydratase/2-oxohepta-3-ene-1,7-dioic acid hydratase in catechol pathway